VADWGNGRVLEYDAPLSTDRTADRVLGQPDFTSNTANNGGVSANSLDPSTVALDAQGNLYVADIGNNRVLEYDAPLTTDRTADRVFGQPDFTSNTANNGGVSANSLYNPIGVALDTQGNLYVTELSNSRVLEYDTPLSSGTTADRVFGQVDFTHNTPNNGGISANSLYYP
jgi:sugar lactone lactonase YvrE